MSETPDDLKYTKSHEWIRELGEGVVEVGITDHAQELMGDMVFVDLPEVGTAVSAEQDCAVVESVKAASDVYAPVSGEVVEINEALNEAPEAVNQNPYAEGWLFRIKLSDVGDLEKLLSVEAYREVLEREE